MNHSWWRGRRRGTASDPLAIDQTEKLMAVWLEEARLVYQDRLARSESIHASAFSLEGPSWR
ncbi:hypothetical protein [Acidipropionibacterium acidipropionici]|uniref:hypothetical protein n=1 Tax=Acidipropionibacterium acidipropionici TaxID=1748 RepID=UPI000AAB43CD|nr:hypothetical protein [Acidipropionibacterium acidipropionici]